MSLEMRKMLLAGAMELAFHNYTHGLLENEALLKPGKY